MFAPSPRDWWCRIVDRGGERCSVISGYHCSGGGGVDRGVILLPSDAM